MFNETDKDSDTVSPTPERKVTRDDLCRSVSFNTRDESEPNDGFTIDGYGAVFDTPTRIDSWEGCFDETIAPGAFKKSLRERVPRMQFDHGTHPLIGSIPIGRFETIEEDSHGLHVVGRLTDNWLIQPVRDAIREGGIDGMSFRFSVVKEEWRDTAGKLIKNDDELYDLLFEGMRTGECNLNRTVKEVRMTEVGPVVWPAYPETTVGVRSKSLTVDLGDRKSLARAAFMIDAAVRETEAENREESAASARTEDVENVNVSIGTLEAATITTGELRVNESEITTEEPPATEERAESNSTEPTPTPSDAADGHSTDSSFNTPYSRRKAMIEQHRALYDHIKSIEPLKE